MECIQLGVTMTSKAAPAEDLASLTDAELGAVLAANDDATHGPRLCALLREASQRLLGKAPGRKPTGWSASVMTHITRHGAIVVTIDEGAATVLFRQQVEGACIEHEILGDNGETSMSVAEAIRVSDELVEDLDAGRMFDGSCGRRT